jgi:tRNA (adenine57-N1/adenine58-N1)-methyltransferase catalytic subunit
MKSYKRILLAKDGRKCFVSSTTQDYHCKDGAVKKKDLVKKKGIVKTAKGKEFTIFKPSMADLTEKMHRGPQIMSRKDVGYVIALVGITRDSVVLDAGAGSGAMACGLGAVAKKVVTCDVDERSIDTTKKNIEYFNLKNVTVKKLDVYSASEAKKIFGMFDVFTLDVPQPWDALLTAQAKVKPGGYLVSYSPNMSQTQSMVNAATKMGFIHTQTVELIERTWVIDERRCRPGFDALGHTGFLSFFRKWNL